MNVQILSLVFGVILCGGGWLALWLGTRLIGAVMGLGMGFVFGLAFSIALGLDVGARSLVELGCSVMGALGGVFFIRALNAFILALIGFLFGILLARLAIQLYCAAYGISYQLTPQVALVLVIIGAGTAAGALWLRRGVAILITAFVGTSFLTASLPILYQFLPWSFLAILVGSLVIQNFLSQLFSRRKSVVSQKKVE
ncbi:MAG: hypothetical protein N2Z21_11010 [Candidatus Sumerlaeaceae bacterium]|nr:hypothetical protein [Candidatus Sumerlaeaceae bacterium]